MPDHEKYRTGRISKTHGGIPTGLDQWNLRSLNLALLGRIWSVLFCRSVTSSYETFSSLFTTHISHWVSGMNLDTWFAPQLCCQLSCPETTSTCSLASQWWYLPLLPSDCTFCWIACILFILCPPFSSPTLGFFTVCRTSCVAPADSHLDLNAELSSFCCFLFTLCDYWLHLSFNPLPSSSTGLDWSGHTASPSLMCSSAPCSGSLDQLPQGFAFHHRLSPLDSLLLVLEFLNYIFVFHFSS